MNALAMQIKAIKLIRKEYICFSFFEIRDQTNTLVFTVYFLR